LRTAEGAWRSNGRPPPGATTARARLHIEVQAAKSSNWSSKLPDNASYSQRSLDSRREVISTRRPKRRPSPRRLCSPRRRRVPEAWSPPTADLGILRGHELRQRQGHAVFRGRAEAVPASLSSTPPTVASIICVFYSGPRHIHRHRRGTLKEAVTHLPTR
jgi:hypothetical protein